MWFSGRRYKTINCSGLFFGEQESFLFLEVLNIPATAPGMVVDVESTMFLEVGILWWEVKVKRKYQKYKIWLLNAPVDQSWDGKKSSPALPGHSQPDRKQCQ